MNISIGEFFDLFRYSSSRIEFGFIAFFSKCDFSSPPRGSSVETHMSVHIRLVDKTILFQSRLTPEIERTVRIFAGSKGNEAGTETSSL